MEDYNGSDHQYIKFILQDTKRARGKGETLPIKWNAGKMNVEILTQALDCGQHVIRKSQADHSERGQTDLSQRGQVEALQR